MIGFWLLQDDHGVAANHDQEFVSRLYAEGFARSTRENDLIFGRQGSLWHRFTLSQKVKDPARHLRRRRVSLSPVKRPNCNRL